MGSLDYGGVGRNGIQDEVYLWSDDNLSCDHFWRFLTTAQQEFVASYPNYGRVACFKGFDPQSFAFNSQRGKEWFERQFELMSRLVGSGMDVYGYVTLTTPKRAPSLEDWLGSSTGYNKSTQIFRFARFHWKSRTLRR